MGEPLSPAFIFDVQISTSAVPLDAAIVGTKFEPVFATQRLSASGAVPETSEIGLGTGSNLVPMVGSRTKDRMCLELMCWSLEGSSSRAEPIHRSSKS